ncbi:hypothetical protein L0Y65_04190 [Candidatus Micrarchaeota archaeon]|nr:hypothetical protein [Candidatus Micrarchaeota archaeon]
MGLYKLPRASLAKWGPRFPIRPSTTLAGLTAALLSDGHIDWNTCDSHPRPKKLVLYSNNPMECTWFLNGIFDLFRIRGKIVKYRPTTGFSNRESFKAIIYSAELARVFILLGLPAGDKTRQSYLVPSWIMNGSPEIKAEFLRVLFNFDGSISLRTRRESAIEMNYTMNKHKDFISNGEQFLSQLKTLLSQFGVSSGKIHIRYCAKEKYTLMLFITNGPSILRFHEKIGFLNDDKIQRLETAVFRINKYRRINQGAEILARLKDKSGTDRIAIEKINEISQVRYTRRQFEHMRRGETLIPIDMLFAARKILKE